MAGSSTLGELHILHYLATEADFHSARTSCTSGLEGTALSLSLLALSPAAACAPLRLLEYTTASDVLPILEAEQRLVVPFFGPQLLSVGNIYQRFTSPDENGQGQVSTWHCSIALWCIPKT
jgi:hypothetical protein